MDIKEAYEFINTTMRDEYTFCVNGGRDDDELARKAFTLDLLMYFFKEVK
jgi:hypothetical protein